MLDSSPTLNRLAAEIVLGWYGGTPEVSPAEIKGLCEQLRSYAVEMCQQEPNFRNIITIPECDLILALVNNTLNEQKHVIVDAYRHAMKHGASPRESGSVIEQLEFLADMAADAGKGKEIRQQAAVLLEIVEQLAPLTEAEHNR